MYAICARCYTLNTTSTSTNISSRRQRSVIHGGSSGGGVSVSGVHPLEELSLQVAHPVHVARRVRVIEGEGHRLADDARLYGQRALIGRYLLDICPSKVAEMTSGVQPYLITHAFTIKLKYSEKDQRHGKHNRDNYKDDKLT